MSLLNNVINKIKYRAKHKNNQQLFNIFNKLFQEMFQHSLNDKNDDIIKNINTYIKDNNILEKRIDNICSMIINKIYHTKYEKDILIIKYYYIMRFIPIYFELTIGLYNKFNIIDRKNLIDEFNKIIKQINDKLEIIFENDTHILTHFIWWMNKEDEKYDDVKIFINKTYRKLFHNSNENKIDLKLDNNIKLDNTPVGLLGSTSSIERNTPVALLGSTSSIERNTPVGLLGAKSNLEGNTIVLLDSTQQFESNTVKLDNHIKLDNNIKLDFTTQISNMFNQKSSKNQIYNPIHDSNQDNKKQLKQELKETLKINNKLNIPEQIINILSKNTEDVQKKFIENLTKEITESDGIGFIYGFTHKNDNNMINNFWIKIGRTEKNNPNDRINQWNGHIEFCQKTKYNKKLERLIHLLFRYANKIRCFNNKNNEIEWFRFDEYINITNIISILNEFIEKINNNDVINDVINYKINTTNIDNNIKNEYEDKIKYLLSLDKISYNEKINYIENNLNYNDLKKLSTFLNCKNGTTKREFSTSILENEPFSFIVDFINVHIKKEYDNRLIHLDKYNNIDAHCNLIANDYYIHDDKFTKDFCKFFIKNYPYYVDKIPKHKMSSDIKDECKNIILKNYNFL
jgi:hypothetical protein